MIGIQSILTATDFSTDARHAAERAAMICATTGISRRIVRGRGRRSESREVQEASQATPRCVGQDHRHAPVIRRWLV